MRSSVMAGAVAGIGAGLVFGAMMQMMTAPTPDGGQMPMMAMVAKVVRSESIGVGWLYHLFNSTVIGAVFGWLFGKARGLGGSLVGGLAYGGIWWVVGGLILMPMFLGMPVFAPLMMPMMRPVAMGSLVGHLLYGLILGALYRWLFRAHELPGDLSQRPANARR